MSEDACRLDVWLWRARFFKTRGLAARFLEDGRVRLTRRGAAEVRVDKAQVAPCAPATTWCSPSAGGCSRSRCRSWASGAARPPKRRALYGEAAS